MLVYICLRTDTHIPILKGTKLYLMGAHIMSRLGTSQTEFRAVFTAEGDSYRVFKTEL